MEHFIKIQENIIKDVMESCGYPVSEVTLTESGKPELGDYQYNGIMPLAKTYHQSPIEIANVVVEKLRDISNFESVNVAGPGFINIRFANAVLVDYMNELNHNLVNTISGNYNKTFVLDYGGPNVAKALHVGHFRPANIGEALKRLARSQGAHVIADVHLGDWGRPLGLVILEIKKRFPNLNYFKEEFTGVYEDLPISNADLIEIYPFASAKAKEDEEYLEEARQITLDLQSHKPGIYDLWKKIVTISIQDTKEIYNTLNVSFDLWYGESDAEKYMDSMLKCFEEKGLLRMSEGALIVDVKEENDDLEMPPVILRTSTGTVTYAATDLATIYQRVKDFNPDEIWYVVDQRQSLHFKQVFRAARMAGIVDEHVKLEFLWFGTMNGQDGKPFKTRDGGVMSLRGLIDTVKEETTKRLNPSIEEDKKDSISESIAIAALKYADLLPNRTTDYVFDPVKFSDLNGKTGPYLLYSTIRMKSLLQKASEQSVTYDIMNNIDNETRNIVIKLLGLASILEKAFQNKSLSDITEYIYVLTSLYNNFYATNKVLLENDKSKQESWLVLTNIVYQANQYLLNVLGIAIPEKM